MNFFRKTDTTDTTDTTIWKPGFNNKERAYISGKSVIGSIKKRDSLTRQT